jgi:hypothetical protein
VADDADDKDRPFFPDDVDDAFKGTETEMVGMIFHSHFITIHSASLILSD